MLQMRAKANNEFILFVVTTFWVCFFTNLKVYSWVQQTFVVARSLDLYGRRGRLGFEGCTYIGFTTTLY